MPDDHAELLERLEKYHGSCPEGCDSRESATAIRDLLAERDGFRDLLVDTTGDLEDLRAKLAHAERRENEQRRNWLEYLALVCEEADIAIAIASVHGWQPTEEDFESGVRCRANMGISDLDGAEKIRAYLAALARDGVESTPAPAPR